MPVFELEKMTFEEVDMLPRDETIIILPMGPLEAHGPHLPLGVDIWGADVLTRLAADLLSERGYVVAIAPLIPYTLSDVAMPFAGTVTLSRPTVIALVQDIARSFARHGFKRLVVNCHHLERPNLTALYKAAAAAHEFGISVLVSNAILDSMPQSTPLMKGEYPQLDFHAGEAETAFFLWRFPESVRPNYKTLSPNWSDLREKFAAGAKDFKEAGGPQCYFGDPSKATAELGQALFAIEARALADEIINWSGSIEKG